MQMYEQNSKNGYEWRSYDGDGQVGRWWTCISKLKFLKKHAFESLSLTYIYSKKGGFKAASLEI